MRRDASLSPSPRDPHSASICAPPRVQHALSRPARHGEPYLCRLDAQLIQPGDWQPLVLTIAAQNHTAPVCEGRHAHITPNTGDTRVRKVADDMNPHDRENVKQDVFENPNDIAPQGD